MMTYHSDLRLMDLASLQVQCSWTVCWRQCMAPHCLPVQSIKPGGAQLWDPRHWDASHHPRLRGVEIWTDHKNLEYFQVAQKLNHQQARWSLYLSRFDFMLYHKPGRSMGKPNALSRWANHGSGRGDNNNLTLLAPELFRIHMLVGTRLEGKERNILRKGLVQFEGRSARGSSGKGGQGALEGQRQRHGEERRVVRERWATHVSW
jgi:hypothetical protein